MRAGVRRNRRSTRSSHVSGARQSASRYTRMSPVAVRRPVSRATTSPLRGSSTTYTCGICCATARVSSVLALLTTTISSGTRVCASREAGGKKPGFVMGADDDAESECSPRRHPCARPPAFALPARRRAVRGSRGIPTCISDSVRPRYDGGITPGSRSGKPEFVTYI